MNIFYGGSSSNYIESLNDLSLAGGDADNIDGDLDALFDGIPAPSLTNNKFNDDLIIIEGEDSKNMVSESVDTLIELKHSSLDSNIADYIEKTTSINPEEHAQKVASAEQPIVDSSLDANFEFIVNEHVDYLL